MKDANRELAAATTQRHVDQARIIQLQTELRNAETKLHEAQRKLSDEDASGRNLRQQLGYAKEQQAKLELVAAKEKTAAEGLRSDLRVARAARNALRSELRDKGVLCAELNSQIDVRLSGRCLPPFSRRGTDFWSPGASCRRPSGGKRVSYGKSVRIEERTCGLAGAGAKADPPTGSDIFPRSNIVQAQ